MGKVMQIEDHAPDVVKEALDSHDLSVNQGYNITRQLQQLPEEEREHAAAEAVEQARSRKTIQQKDAERERRARIARGFSTAFENACAMDVTVENVTCWTECSRMTPGEMEDMVQEARELSETFSRIADILQDKIMNADGRADDGAAEDSD